MHYLRWRAHGDALYERATVCSVEGCERVVEARGYCLAHYLRWRRTGESGDAPVRAPVLEHEERCSVQRCARPFYAGSLCRKHYDRRRQAGDPTAPDRRAGFDAFSPEFWDQLDRSGGPKSCWPWLHGQNAGGYGRIMRAGRTHLAHRVAWALANGAIPRGALVLHSCDNPPCCNPAHLLLGSHGTNMADMKAKRRGRGGNRGGEANSAAKLTDAHVAEIRARYPGQSQTALAREFGVRQAQISRIVTGARRARDVPAAALPTGNARQRAARHPGAEVISTAKLMARDGWRCAICTEPIPREAVWPDRRCGTIDHRVPLARGGAHTWANVQAAHLDCNVRKSVRLAA